MLYLVKAIEKNSGVRIQTVKSTKFLSIFLLSYKHGKHKYDGHFHKCLNIRNILGLRGKWVVHILIKEFIKKSQVSHLSTNPSIVKS